MNAGMKMMLVTQQRERGGDMRYEQGGASPRAGGYAREPMAWPANPPEHYEAPESKFRDRRGREHYDNGRYAPKGSADWMAEDDTRSERSGSEMRRGSTRYEGGGARPGMTTRREMPSNVIGFESAAAMRGAGHSKPQDERRGHASEDSGSTFDHETAKEWTQGMKNADGTRGPHWTMDQAKSLMGQVGATDCEPAEFWAVLNSLYSDYSTVLKKFGVDRTEVYAHLAKAWLHDKDAVPDKAAAYYEYVVEHE